MQRKQHADRSTIRSAVAVLRVSCRRLENEPSRALM